MVIPKKPPAPESTQRGLLTISKVSLCLLQFIFFFHPPNRKYWPELRTDWTVMSAGLCFCNSGAVHYAHLGLCVMREAWCLPLLSNMMTNPGYLFPKSLNNRAYLYPVGARRWTLIPI
eukprot:scaffold5593_cov92-Cylindrotheca_fusiformis.AAC.2